MNRIVVGVDIAKRLFQLHWVEPETGEIVALQLRRERFLEHFANRSNCLIGMEACGGSQHWARSLQKLGHEVKLIPGRMVKPFVVGNKNDAADARGIWMAVQQPEIKAVALKSEEQQAVLALQRLREQLVKFRTAQINGLRGLLTEYGEGNAAGPSRDQARYSGRFGAVIRSAASDRDRDLARTVCPPRRGSMGRSARSSGACGSGSVRTRRPSALRRSPAWGS